MAVKVQTLRPVENGRQSHFRIWGDDSDPDELVRSLLTNHHLKSPVHLEFWDERCPTEQTLQSLGLNAVGQPPSRFVWNADWNQLGSILMGLQDCSFGGWFGVDSATVGQVAREHNNERRAQRLLPGGAFVVFSLYDDNVEIFGTEP